MKKFFCLVLGASILAGAPLHAISKQTAAFLTIATGAGAAGLTAYVTPRSLTPLTRGLICGVAGGITGWVGWNVFYSFTPEGRLDAAQGKMTKVSRHPLALQSYTNKDLFIEALQEVYIGDDLWLVSAFNEMTLLLEDARLALELIEKARVEAADSNLLHILQQCNSLSPHVRQAIINITSALKMIRAHPEYIQQVKLHKEMIAAQQKLLVQQQMANAQAQMAAAQIHNAFIR